MNTKTENKKILGRTAVIAMIISMFMVVSPMTASAATGDDCTDPIVVNITADLPYTDTNQTTCGRGHDYDSTAMGYYDNGEDIIYRLDVSSAADLDFTMTSDTTYTGMGLFDNCPDTGNLLISDTGSGTNCSFSYSVTPGTYYLMIDTWPTPDCINSFNLTIAEHKLIKTVHPNDPEADYTTIQDAIDAASDGDFIEVWNSTYYENVVVDKRLTIYSRDGADVTIVDGGGNTVFDLNHDWVNLTGFTVTNATNQHEEGIYIGYNDNCNVSNNIVVNNYNGITLYSADFNDIINNTVKYNSARGIFLSSYCNDNVISKNTIIGNGGSSGDGIYINGADDNEITCNCIGYNNEHGIYLRNGATGNNISYNCIVKNGNYNSTSSGWEYNFYNDQSYDVDAKYNWWNTTVAAEINASIFDHYDDSSKGIVNFSGYLSAPSGCQPSCSPPPVTLYFVPQHTKALKYCNNTVIQVMANAPMGINGTQLGISYDPGCAKIVDVDFNPVWTTTSWNTTCSASGVDWMTFSNASNQGPGDVWLFNITVHCEHTGCSTDLNFTCGSPCDSCPIEIRNIAGALGFTRNNGTFTCGPDLNVTKITVNPDVPFLCDKAFGPTNHTGARMQCNNISAVIEEDNGIDVIDPFNVTFVITNTSTGAEVGNCTVNLTGLAGGSSKTVYCNCSWYPFAAETYTINVTVDSDSVIPETDETNNTMLRDITPCVYGLKGDSWQDGRNITTWQCYDQDRINLTYSLGNSTRQSGYYTKWTKYVVGWTPNNFSIPPGATIKEARLYVYYDWDFFPALGMPNVTNYFNLSFNGGSNLTPDAIYTDRKNPAGCNCGYSWGPWGDCPSMCKYNYEYGMIAYNVTDNFTKGGSNTAILYNSAPNPPAGFAPPNTCSVKGMLLVVVYSDSSEPERIIWINEGFDMLKAGKYHNSLTIGGTLYYHPFVGVTTDEATTYTPFTKCAAIPTGDIANAKLITVTNDPGDQPHALYFNGVPLGIGSVWVSPPSGGIGYGFGINVTGVPLGLINATNNTAAVQSYDDGNVNGGDWFEATNTFLILEKKVPTPTPTPTVTPTPTLTPTPTPTPKPVPAITPLGFIVALVSLFGLAAVAMREMHKR